MRRHTEGGASRVLLAAVSALLLVAGVALVPAAVSAQNGAISGDISPSGDGGVVVEIENGTGPFDGGEETVTIEIKGEEDERTVQPGNDSSTYVYEITGESLRTDMGDLAATDLSAATVTVTHESGASFNDTVDLRYAKLGGSQGSFTDGGALRVDFETAVGLGESGDVPLTVEVGETTESVTASLQREEGANESHLVIDRGRLVDLGLLDDPRPIKVGGQPGEADYLAGSATVDLGAMNPPTTGERTAAGVALSNPFFVAGETYVIDARPADGDGRYLERLDATAGDGGGELVADSSTLLAADRISLTVDRNGNALIEGESVALTSRAVGATLEGDGTVSLDPEPDGGTVNALWVETDEGVERYDASLDNGTLSISDENVALSEDDQLLIDFADAGSVYATFGADTGGDGGGDGATAGQTDERAGGLAGMLASTLGGLTDAVTSNPWIAGGVAFAVLLVLIVGVLLYRRRSSRGPIVTLPVLGAIGGRSSPGKSPAKTPTIDVTFHIADDRGGGAYTDADAVVARPLDGNFGGQRSGYNTASANETRIELDGGIGEEALEPGAWQFDVIEGNRSIRQKQKTLEVDFDSEKVPLSVPPYKITARVTGGIDNEPLKGAVVRADPDVGDPAPRSRRTDPNGSAEFEIPRSASTVVFESEYDQLPSARTKQPVDAAARNGVKLEMAPEIGSIDVETTVGSRHWPGVEVDVKPVGGDATAYADPGTITTNDEGRKTITKLPTGQYELSAHPTLSAVETARVTETATVDADETTAVTLSIDISFELPGSQRERLSELRDRIAELSSARNRDVAIPYYYGTVLDSVLDLVEAIEAAPERAVESGLPPGATTDALLRATDEGIDAVEGAMSERRNIKLFRACESMPSVEPSWDGDADLESFFERTSEGGDKGRRALRDRLAETDEFLDTQWGEVGEIGPARKLHDRIGDLARRSGNVDDELTVVAQAYVSICLLDAIESLFEHDALIERLNSGGY
ncbi:hypothetical protein [Halobellus sp. GM3]|uniref:hypothetical protein n=1 Tax=Halobellus sp. GM3 TaxID=3458410 RepID=UPI00403D7FC9